MLYYRYTSERIIAAHQHLFDSHFHRAMGEMRTKLAIEDDAERMMEHAWIALEFFEMARRDAKDANDLEQEALVSCALGLIYDKIFKNEDTAARVYNHAYSIW